MEIIQTRLKSFFENNGYVVIDDAIDKKTCEKVLIKVRELINTNKLKKVSFGDSNFKTINGEKLLESIPEVEVLYDEFIGIATTLCKKKLYKLKNSKIGASLNLTTHNDSFQFHYDRNLITVVAYMNSVQGGKMIISPKARLFSKKIYQKNLFSKFFSLIETIKTKLAETSLIEKVVIEPKIGKVIIFQGRETLHKVEKVERGYDRVSIQFAYDLDANLFSPESTKDYYGN